MDFLGVEHESCQWRSAKEYRHARPRKGRTRVFRAARGCVYLCTVLKRETQLRGTVPRVFQSCARSPAHVSADLHALLPVCPRATNAGTENQHPADKLGRHHASDRNSAVGNARTQLSACRLMYHWRATEPCVCLPIQAKTPLPTLHIFGISCATEARSLYSMFTEVAQSRRSKRSCSPRLHIRPRNTRWPSLKGATSPLRYAQALTKCHILSSALQNNLPAQQAEHARMSSHLYLSSNPYLTFLSHARTFHDLLFTFSSILRVARG